MTTLYLHEKIIFIFFIQQKIKKRQLFMFYEQNVQNKKSVYVYVDWYQEAWNWREHKENVKE